MAKQDRGIENIANTIGGMGRAHVKAQSGKGQQRPIATPQMGTNTPAPRVSKAKAMNDFAHANDFLKPGYGKPVYKPKPAAARRAKTTAVKKAGRGR
jgi:hypothetical protein